MPTGYTAELMEKGQTFHEFIMGCSRAFGALITMRDDPKDAMIPKRFEPSNYHAKSITESLGELAKLKSMTDKEKLAFGQAEKDEDIKSIERRFEKQRVENKRLEAMEANVRAWNPPTYDHRGLKDFMLEQINISKNDSRYIQTSLDAAIDKPEMVYYVEAVSNASHNIKYHTEENDKEIKRANERTEWVRQLRLSI